MLREFWQQLEVRQYKIGNLLLAFTERTFELPDARNDIDNAGHRSNPDCFNVFIVAYTL